MGGKNVALHLVDVYELRLARNHELFVLLLYCFVRFRCCFFFSEGFFFVFIFRRLLREDPLGAVRALHTPSLASIVRPRRLQRLKRRLSRKQGLPNLTTGRGVRRQQLILGCRLQPLLVEVLLAAQRVEQLTILLPPRGVTRRLE